MPANGFDIQLPPSTTKASKQVRLLVDRFVRDQVDKIAQRERVRHSDVVAEALQALAEKRGWTTKRKRG